MNRDKRCNHFQDEASVLSDEEDRSVPPDLWLEDQAMNSESNRRCFATDDPLLRPRVMRVITPELLTEI